MMSPWGTSLELLFIPNLSALPQPHADASLRWRAGGPLRPALRNLFDPGELKDAVHPVLDERIWNNDETVVSRRLSKLLRSPVDEAWMESIVLDSKPPLTLDRCTNTGGIWLDDGECLKLYDFVLERGQNKDHTLSEERETRRDMELSLSAI